MPALWVAMKYKLIGELEDVLKCLICLGPAIDAQQELKCGRLFCSGCIKQWQKMYCPHCKDSPEYFPDTRSKCMLLLCTTDIMTAYVNRR